MATQETTGTTGPDTTVLFVDDEPDLLELYEVLCGTEHDVLTAESGEEALEKFGPHVDLALLDRRMPGMVGEEVIRELRDRGYETPVGIVSAVEPETEPGVEHDVYLTKRVDRSELLAAIDRHV
jgi:DNA-binding response OmpR family regulator